VAAGRGGQPPFGLGPARYAAGAQPDSDVHQFVLVADAEDHADHSGGSPASIWRDPAPGLVGLADQAGAAAGIRS
jgi:hypothetical protein